MGIFFLKHKLAICLFVIFLIALIVRFLYFPNNVHFSFDQARDSFTSLELLKGDLKLIGPPSFLSNKLFPGPLIFYLYAPIYLLFHKSPEAASAFFRVWNALGVFLVFPIASILFNKRVGIITAILFAISYEQSQYSIFLSHQPLAVITVLLFYLGLCLYLFLKKPWGILLSVLGLGLSIQFHYGFAYLVPAFIAFFIFFRKKIITVKIKWIVLSILIFIATTSSFILTELKYRFMINLILQYPNSSGSHFFSGVHFRETLFIINRFLHDSFLVNYQITPFLGILLLIITIYLYRQKQTREKILFLIIWFVFGLSLYIFSGVYSYYYSPATSVSLLIFVSYLINKLFSSGKVILSILILVIVITNNLFSISTINPNGLNSDMVIQPGMTTSNQRRVLDYIYYQLQGQPFAVGALTVPLSINTTWDYLFNWYGKEEYGYLPVWIGPKAEGYPGNLTTINSRSNLPKKQFLIIEPTIGIRKFDIDNFLRVEGYFTKIVEEKKFGTISVQLREPY